MRRYNSKRRKKLYAKQFGPHADHIRNEPCCVCRRPPPSDPSHIKSRGAGGTWRDLVPMCRMCHIRFGNKYGENVDRFLEDTGIDLRAIADDYVEAFSDGKKGDYYGV